VVDRDDLDRMRSLDDSVDHAVCAPSRTPKAFELEAKWLADSVWSITDMVDCFEHS
jgi:hypothetical protein